MAACLVRVPTAVVTQRMQVGRPEEPFVRGRLLFVCFRGVVVSCFPRPSDERVRVLSGVLSSSAAGTPRPVERRGGGNRRWRDGVPPNTKPAGVSSRRPVFVVVAYRRKTTAARCRSASTRPLPRRSAASPSRGSARRRASPPRRGGAMGTGGYAPPPGRSSGPAASTRDGRRRALAAAAGGTSRDDDDRERPSVASERRGRDDDATNRPPPSRRLRPSSPTHAHTGRRRRLTRTAAAAAVRARASYRIVDPSYAASVLSRGTFYLGYWTTVAREIPFSFIQFPLYEVLDPPSSRIFPVVARHVSSPPS